MKTLEEYVKGRKELEEWEKELLIPAEEFLECMNAGGFTDYDGYGYFSDGQYKYKPVDFSQATQQIAYGWDYVVWYNK